jgi:hypothetical protein
MDNRRGVRTNLACVIGALLIVAVSARSVEAIPLDNATIDIATLCAMFDCGAGASSASNTYSIAPDPDPDGTLASLVLPGITAETAGTFLYAYQLAQDDGSTAVLTGLSVPFAGLFGSPFSFSCTDCGGTEAPSLVDFTTGPDTIAFSLAGLLAGQTSTLFGAISNFGPAAGVANIAAVEGGVAVETLVPGAADVPEPASFMLFGLGIAGLAVARRRKQ